MLIRAFEPHDLAHWESLWQGYQRFYKVEIPQAVSATTWKRFFDPNEPIWGAIALDGDQALGFVHYVYHRSTWTAENYCYLQDLFTLEAARGRGVGRKLIEHVYAQAEEAGAARVYWLTHETNQTAMKLYDQVADKSGFVQYRKTLR